MLWPLFMAPRLIATAPRTRRRVVSEPPTAVPAETPLGFAWWLDETGDIISRRRNPCVCRTRQEATSMEVLFGDFANLLSETTTQAILFKLVVTQ